jgi:hypothetical protein
VLFGNSKEQERWTGNRPRSTLPGLNRLGADVQVTGKHSLRDVGRMPHLLDRLARHWGWRFWQLRRAEIEFHSAMVGHRFFHGTHELVEQFCLHRLILTFRP